MNETEIIKTVERGQLAFLWHTTRMKQIDNLEDISEDEELTLDLDLEQIEEDSKIEDF